ncbi:MAG: hypothetical protein K5666_01830 [Bacilli bacterium]|nr:hypothetical protein [Bacilli bacterium]
MIDVIKKYVPHSINVGFLLSLVMILFFRSSPSVMLFCLLAVIFFLSYVGEIIYFIVQAREQDVVEKPHITYPLMVLFGLYYIPCFSVKKMEQDEEYKVKNFIYLALSLILTVLVVIMLFVNKAQQSALKVEVINIEKDISFKLPEDFQQQRAQEFDYLYTSGKNYVGVNIIRRSMDAKASLDYQKEELLNSLKNSKILDKKDTNDGYKVTSSYTIEGTTNNNVFIYVISVIYSVDSRKPIIKVTESCLKRDYDANKTTFKKIIQSFKYL